MNPKHVTSLELSKRLKELGFPQESYAWWSDREKLKNLELYFEGERISDEEWFSSWVEKELGGEIYSAYLASELGELIPLTFFSGPCVDSGYVAKALILTGEKGEPEEHEWFADTEADSRAKLLIHLAEKQLINPPKE